MTHATTDTTTTTRNLILYFVALYFGEYLSHIFPLLCVINAFSCERIDRKFASGTIILALSHKYTRPHGRALRRRWGGAHLRHFVIAYTLSHDK